MKLRSRRLPDALAADLQFATEPFGLSGARSPASGAPVARRCVGRPRPPCSSRPQFLLPPKPGPHRKPRFAGGSEFQGPAADRPCCPEQGTALAPGSTDVLTRKRPESLRPAVRWGAGSTGAGGTAGRKRVPRPPPASRSATTSPRPPRTEAEVTLWPEPALGQSTVTG